MIKIWALVRNQVQREFSSPFSLVFFLILPLIFTAAVGAGLSGFDAPVQEPQYQLSLVDHDGGELSQALRQALADANVETWPVDVLDVGDYGLTIPADFGERLLVGETADLSLQVKSADNNSVAVEQAVQAAIRRLDMAAQVASMGLDQARDLFVIQDKDAEVAFYKELLLDTMATTETPSAITEVRWVNHLDLDPSLKQATAPQQASAGQIVTWVQITFLGASIVLVGERNEGTLSRLLTAPIERSILLGGQLLARLLMGLAQMTLLLIGGALIFRVDWGRAPGAVALVSVTFSLAMVALGMLLATLVRSEEQANSLTIGLSMAMSALGGAWFPLEITPPIYRQVVQVLPSTWAMRAYTDLLARNGTLVDVLPHIGVLFGFALLFGVLGGWRMRRYVVG